MEQSQLRKEMIQNCIKNRKERGELTSCIFYISIPDARNQLLDNPLIKKISGMLNKYHIDNGICDTVSGAYNLNRDWLETGVMDCAVEYCGVYPVDWDIEDVLEFEDLEYSGQILVNVIWKLGEHEYEPNH